MTDLASANAPTSLPDILAAQRAAFGRMPAPSLSERRTNLKRLRKAILAKRSQIEEAINLDFGHRSRAETAIMEVMALISGIDYLHANLGRFMKPGRRHVGLTMRSGRARVEYQPLGVVGIMAPWNYPLSLALMPLATALAAGNRAMIKPSEFTPWTSALMVRLLADLFTQDHVAVVTGDASVGAAFSALPFDHLVFTGSTAVGRSVMRAASENLVPVTLELGGKSPVIVAVGQDLDAVARDIAFGKLANAGQTCVAPDYVLMPRDEIDAFVVAYHKAVAALYPGGPDSDDYTAIVNARHFGRLTAMIEDARARGARVIQTGRTPEAAASRQNTIAPTLVLEPTDDMLVAQEEIFGPILPIIACDGVGAAIAYVNARPRPLALYYFGADNADRRNVLDRTVSGNVTINGTLMHYAQEDLPFGGVGASGMGAYHGIEGFRALSHAKGIYEQGRWNGSRMMRPPFDRATLRMLNLMLR